SLCFFRMLFNMIEYVAHVSVSKKLYGLILPRSVTILEMSISELKSDRPNGNFEVLGFAIEG
ncbi:hypothetical protein QUB70_22120, partial [Microcoleus sp. A003_D6]|uniref:hypothetical protein n=1 Tax=Microcoleus sp. A003_D6 TaxID=3055266 RepID=UPI002FD79A09